MDVNSVIRYFDLHSNRRSEIPEQRGGGGVTSSQVPEYWIAIYLLAAYFGVLARDLIAAGGFELSPFIYVKLFVIVLLIFPSVYKQVIDNLDSAIIRATASFAGGFGYQTIVEASALPVLQGG